MNARIKRCCCWWWRRRRLRHQSLRSKTKPPRRRPYWGSYPTCKHRKCHVLQASPTTGLGVSWCHSSRRFLRQWSCAESLARAATLPNEFARGLLAHHRSCEGKFETLSLAGIAMSVTTSKLPFSRSEGARQTQLGLADDDATKLWRGSVSWRLFPCALSLQCTPWICTRLTRSTAY